VPRREVVRETAAVFGVVVAYARQLIRPRLGTEAQCAERSARKC